MSKIKEYCNLLESLARLEHEQWSHWIDFQLNKCAIDPRTMTKEECEEARDKWESWVDKANTPYEKLTEKDKKSDREWARKVLDLVFRWAKEEKRKVEEILNSDIMKMLSERMPFVKERWEGQLQVFKEILGETR